MPRPKVILNLYPVFPANGFADRVARRPLGADRDIYQRVVHEWTEIIQAAERMGVWGCSAIEHHFHSEGYEVAPTPGVLNAYWAGQTSRIHIGALGYVIGTWDPIRLAEETAILDHLLKGRYWVGLARGYQARWANVLGQHSGAIDAARTAKRLGATEAIIVYRRTRDRMPAHDFEVEEALQEGIMMKWLSTIKRVEEGELTVEKMVLDEKGFPQPTGEIETLAADSLVLALGQDVDLELLDGVPGLEVKDGVVRVGPNMMTGFAGVFAGGDMVPSERTVTVAVGHGKKAARHIDAWLRGEAFAPPPKHELASFDKLNGWYYADAPKTVRPTLDLARRKSTFEEVQKGLDETNALYEARRCLSCGNCFECDNCYGICPDNAVVKLGPGNRFRFNYDYCKGCGVCAQECPCGAIAMVPEEI